MKKIFRKIHLWLSVPFGIIITLICFSGSMLVFEKEISEWCHPELYFVEEVKERALPLDQLMEKAAATLPDSISIAGVSIFPDAKRAYQVNLSKPRHAAVYIDQYTGEIKGRHERLPFYDVMYHLHRWLMGASQSKDGGMPIGRLLVGISTIALIIILVTGILMWLTNKHKPLKKSLTISFTKGWPRFWHDLHVAGGIYATIFLLALALTGLTWSFSWYRTGFYGLCGVEESGGYGHASHAQEGRQDSKRRHEGEMYGERNNGNEVARHNRGLHADSAEAYSHRSSAYNGRHSSGEDERAYGEGEEYRGRHGHGGRGRHRHEQGDADGYAGGHRHTNDLQSYPAEYGETAEPEFPAMETAPSPFAHWQEVYENLAQANPDYRQIRVSDGSANVVPASRNSLRAGDSFDFDPESGAITGNKPYSEQDKSVKVRSTVYTVHVGSWGGIFTRILTFLAALLGATLPLTGYYLWIRRLVNKSAHKHTQPRA